MDAATAVGIAWMAFGVIVLCAHIVRASWNAVIVDDDRRRVAWWKSPEYKELQARQRYERQMAAAHKRYIENDDMPGMETAIMEAMREEDERTGVV